MHKEIKKILPVISNELLDEGVSFFKVGITQNVAEREEDEEYKAFHLFPIARSNDPNVIADAEKDIISYFLSQPQLCEKCANEQIGGGQIEEATWLYLAIRYRPDNRWDPLLAFAQIELPVNLDE